MTATSQPGSGTTPSALPAMEAGAARRKPPGRRWVAPLLLVLGMAVLYFAVVRQGAVPAGWLTDLDQARRQAAQTQRPVLVEFGAGWCPPCRKMKADVFPDPRVQARLADFVCVHLDAMTQPRAMAQYRVERLPTLIVLDPAGAVRARYEGGLSVEELLAFLRRATTAESVPSAVEGTPLPDSQPRNQGS